MSLDIIRNAVRDLTRKVGLSSWKPVTLTNIPGEAGKALSGMPGTLNDGELWFVVGKNGGEFAYERLDQMPHLLVAGTTGSGKSVFLNGLLTSLLTKHTCEDLRLGLVDPKMVEFAVYGSLTEHLLRPVANDLQSATDLMQVAVDEMERRLTMFQKLIHSGKMVKSLSDYNKVSEEKLPRWVLVVDEFADLIMGAKSEGKDARELRARFESLITRVAQKARAAGIHLVLATQKPTEKVVTSLLKGNIPARAGFKVQTPKESEVILDTYGLADKLKGAGDMYFKDSTGSIHHLQGVWVPDATIQLITAGN